MSTEAFYVPLSHGQFRATDATVGPWSPSFQHGGPPAALLAHEIERVFPRPETRIGQIAFDFFGSVPVGELAVTVERVRGGARIELLRARLEVAGKTAMQASAWRLLVQPGRSPAVLPKEVPLLVPSEQPQEFFASMPRFGYGESLEWRFVDDGFAQPGPATVWTRPRLPLVEGMRLTPLERLLLMVDSANGISAELDLGSYSFVPVELTVVLHRHPLTEWVGMTAQTVLEPDGLGMTRASLFDERGDLGEALQTLFVAPRTQAR